MNKEEIRILYKQKRRKLASSEKDKLEDLMLIHFQKLSIFENFSIMSYAPIEVQNEFDPYLCEEFCFFKNENTAFSYPIVNRNTDVLEAFIVNDETEFELNDYGIAEPIGGIKINPKEIQVILLPLLAFDESGYRVGYGKGYYDKFIKLCSPKVIKVGFSFFEADVIDDINALDEKMDYCITPNRIYEF
jgi:5-formyltetrahydrofolate cyclo-ligase